ncbi:MAG TPA: GNAT family N-acetyltransferase [Candidatus Gallacutalibacter stercoravium]|nr:GNAT family N-acetyltransferase [Candidatus Gallacutalibacter stercoravium]
MQNNTANIKNTTVVIRPFTEEYAPGACAVWNQVVEDGVAFPQEQPLSCEEGAAFFQEQSFTGVALDGEQVVGLYILHPNNVGRCGHIANASFAVRKEYSGRHIGGMLVDHCLAKAAQLGFRIMQFNAVVATNAPARHLYQKKGFHQLGCIPGGFRLKDGSYEDIVLYYRQL